MEHIVILASGAKSTDFYAKLCEIISDMDCFISQAKGATFGAESTCAILVTGNWNNIAKLETACNKLSDKTTTVITKRTERSVSELQALPYSIHVIATDQVGLVSNICLFLKEHGTQVENFEVETYLSNYSSTPMLAITISMCVPSHTSIAELREQFLIFCEDLNIDGVIEPERE
jgi:glycine cleavage system transcriptional repressor